MGLSALLQSAWREDAFWLRGLIPVSWLYLAILSLRRHLYRRGWREIYRAPVPVIVVGNISVGGTGKTPVVIALARAMLARGFRVGIVSRGYGAAPGGFPRRVTADSDWREAGDEPLMIARLTGCPVVIAPRRGDAVAHLLAWQPVDLVISDDGLQHLALGRDMEIVLLDARHGIGNGRVLPSGPLRESPSRLGSCDWILQRDSIDPSRHFSYRVDGVVGLLSGELHPPDSLAGRTVHAVAGIAHPEGFFAALRQLGMQVHEHSWPDHHPFDGAEFAGLEGQPVLMTEKDAVKCEAFAGPDFRFLRISAQLPEALIDRVASLAGGRAPIPHQG